MALATSHGPFAQTVGPPAPIAPQTGTGFNPQRASADRQAMPAENLAANERALAQTGDYV